MCGAAATSRRRRRQRQRSMVKNKVVSHERDDAIAKINVWRTNERGRWRWMRCVECVYCIQWRGRRRRLLAAAAAGVFNDATTTTTKREKIDMSSRHLFTLLPISYAMRCVCASTCCSTHTPYMRLPRVSNKIATETPARRAHICDLSSFFFLVRRAEPTRTEQNEKEEENDAKTREEYEIRICRMFVVVVSDCTSIFSPFTVRRLKCLVVRWLKCCHTLAARAHARRRRKNPP